MKDGRAMRKNRFDNVGVFLMQIIITKHIGRECGGGWGGVVLHGGFPEGS